MQRLHHSHSLIQRAFVRKAEAITTSTTDATSRRATTTLNPLASINSIISAALDPAPTTSTTTRDTRTTSTTSPTTTTTRTPRTTTSSSIASVDPVITNVDTPVKATTTPITTPTSRNLPATSRISSSILTNGRISSSITSNSNSPTPSSTNLSANSTNQSSKTSNHNTVTIVVIVIVVLLVILLAIAGFFGYKHYKKKRQFARDEADGIVGNSAFRKEGEDHDDFGNTTGAIGRDGSYSRNNDGNNEKFYNNPGGYGALAGESPGPHIASYNNNNNSQYATSSPFPEGEAGFAGRGTKSAGESNQFIQVSSPNGITPSFISSPTHSPSNYGSNQQHQQNTYYTQSPYTSNRQAPIDHLPFSPAYSGSSRYPQSYPPTSSAGSNTNLIRDQQQQQQYRNQVGGAGGVGTFAYNPDNHQNEEEEDVASEIGSAALRSNENFEEEEDNRQPLETIHEGDGSSENIPGPFAESENQGQIFTVKRTFEPSMPDELIIFPGDKVMLLVRYDDGWALGENQSQSGEKKGPLRGVFPYDCLESSTPPSASTLPAPISLSQLEVSHLGRPLSPQTNLSNNFSAPQLAPIRHDSPLGLPGGFARAQTSSPQVAEQTYHQYQPTHSHQASLVNGIPDTPYSPAESDILGHYDRPLTTYGDQEKGGMIPIGNRSGEKSKRSSSLKANRDAELFVALGGVLEDNDEEEKA